MGPEKSELELHWKYQQAELRKFLRKITREAEAQALKTITDTYGPGTTVERGELQEIARKAFIERLHAHTDPGNGFGLS